MGDAFYIPTTSITPAPQRATPLVVDLNGDGALDIVTVSRSGDILLRTGQPVGVCEAFQDRMLALDATVIRISVAADDVSGFADAEQFREPEFRAWLKVLVVQAGLETSHQRPTGVHVGAELLALVIAENGNVGQQQRTVFTDPF